MGQKAGWNILMLHKSRNKGFLLHKTTTLQGRKHKCEDRLFTPKSLQPTICPTPRPPRIGNKVLYIKKGGRHSPPTEPHITQHVEHSAQHSTAHTGAPLE